MEFNDGSQFRVVIDPAEYMRHREMFEFRVSTGYGEDSAWRRHRDQLSPCRALLMYYFPYQGLGSPEQQAHGFCDLIGTLRDNEMVMLDTEQEGGLADPADFTRRWCAVAEARLQTLSWIYVPSALAGALTRAVTGARIVKAPRYSGTAQIGAPPWWPHDVHQYTDRGYFPGCAQSGDTNVTAWTARQLLDRCHAGGDRVARQQKLFLT